MKDLLQGDSKFMNNGWVLLAVWLASRANVPIPWESIQVETSVCSKWIISIHLHVLIITATCFTSKEDIERVCTPKESSKGGMRVPMKSVSGSVALTFPSEAISSFET